MRNDRILVASAIWRGAKGASCEPKTSGPARAHRDGKNATHAEFERSLSLSL